MIDPDNPCPLCRGEVGHRIDCPHGIAFSSKEAALKAEVYMLKQEIETLKAAVIPECLLEVWIDSMPVSGLLEMLNQCDENQCPMVEKIYQYMEKTEASDDDNE